MRVTNLQVHENGENKVFSADFIISTPFGEKKDRRFFYFNSFFQILVHPFNFFKNGFSSRYTIHYTVPSKYAQLANYADSFFLISFPLALALNENLYFDEVVSLEILKKIPLLKKYFPKGTREIDVFTKPGSTKKNIGKNTAQFFSLGADSFYTLFCFPPKPSEKPRALIFVAGYDVPLKKKTFLEEIYRRIKRVALQTGNTSVFIKTNVREVSDKILGWGQFHVAALSAVGMLLPFKKICISGETFESDHWGLRYGADELFSTSTLKFELIAHNNSRDVKIKKILKSPEYLRNIFLKNVRVCWENIMQEHVPYNCSNCQKCFRTQLTFLALGIEKTPTFNPLDMEKLKKIYVVPHMRPEWIIVHKLLKEKPGIDPKIIAAITQVLNNPAPL